MQGRVTDVGEGDRGGATGAAAERQDHGRGRGRVITDLALLFHISPAVTGPRHGNADLGQDLVLSKRGEEGGLVERPGGDFPRASRPLGAVAGIQRLHDGRHVVARIAVGDVAPDGAAVTDLGIGDHQGRLAQDRAGRAQEVGIDHLLLRRQRADHQCLALAGDPPQGGDVTQIDDMARLRQAQLHHRYQAVAAGQQTGFVAMLAE